MLVVNTELQAVDHKFLKKTLANVSKELVLKVQALLLLSPVRFLACLQTHHKGLPCLLLAVSVPLLQVSHLQQHVDQSLLAEDLDGLPDHAGHLILLLHKSDHIHFLQLAEPFEAEVLESPPDFGVDSLSLSILLASYQNLLEFLVLHCEAIPDETKQGFFEMD